MSAKRNQSRNNDQIKVLIIQESKMNTGTEQLKQMNQSSIDAASKVATIALTGAAQMAKLQMDAAKASLQETTGNSKALLSVTEPQEFAALRSQIAEAQIKSAISLSRNMYDIAMQTQGEFAKFAELQFAAFNQTMVSALDQASKSAPGADVAIAGIKSTLAASTAAIESMTKAGKQFAGMADANFKAAADATTKAAVRV
jgi:phasin family protein